MALPDIINHQDFLLTIHTNDEKLIKRFARRAFYPLMLDSENGVWVLRVLFGPGTVLPKHFHWGCTFIYPAGSWHYTEYLTIYKWLVAIYLSQAVRFIVTSTSRQH